jgi:hypothetical protein
MIPPTLTGVTVVEVLPAELLLLQDILVMDADGEDPLSVTGESARGDKDRGSA